MSPLKRPFRIILSYKKFFHKRDRLKTLYPSILSEKFYPIEIVRCASFYGEPFNCVQKAGLKHKL